MPTTYPVDDLRFRSAPRGPEHGRPRPGQAQGLTAEAYADMIQLGLALLGEHREEMRRERLRQDVAQPFRLPHEEERP